MHARILLIALGGAAAFAPLGLRCLAAACRRVELRDQQLLVQEGSSASRVFVIVEGECRVTLRPPPLP